MLQTYKKLSDQLDLIEKQTNYPNSQFNQGAWILNLRKKDTLDLKVCLRDYSNSLFMQIFHQLLNLKYAGLNCECSIADFL
jgi:hypothetical protein